MLTRKIAAPDPFLLPDNFAGLFSHRQTSGLKVRNTSPVIDPAKRTLILLTGGQSLGANVTPTLYVPGNSLVVDQMNIFDGAIREINGPLLGATYNNSLSLGPGNIFVRAADKLVTDGKFDRVIVGCTNIGSTAVAAWADGIHATRLAVLMARFASRGIVPGMTGVTFACVFDIGEEDLSLGTPQASVAASLNKIKNNLFATGFNGRMLLPVESGLGQTSNAVRSAQQGIIDGIQIFPCGDFDAISGRQDGVHWDDSGAIGAGNLVAAQF
jgi:hypothetical protein